MLQNRHFFLLLSLGLMIACQPNAQEERSANSGIPAVATSNRASTDLDPYWYQGKAELNSYELEQSRYGEIHPGYAVLVFVTEDFLTDKQVKNESYQSSNSTKILKTNHLRKFPTGIYDYALMTSVFNSVDRGKYPHALKVSFSAQDWCGQSFMQINNRGKGYEVEIRSYFEQEGDQNYTVNQELMLEDELFNLVRIDPMALPTGKISLYPSATYTRLLHEPFEALEATASRNAYTGSEFTGPELMEYRIVYRKANRSVSIVYESASPYRIAGWKESTLNPYTKKELSTVAKRKKTMLSPYWSQHDLADAGLRKELGIE
ncbi:MAG: hypothetical protein AAFQ68_07425 [Bacteroidota bacterium]